MANEELWLTLRADIEDIKGKLNEVTMHSNATANSMSSTFTTAAKQIAGVLGAAFSVQTIVSFTKQSINAFAETEYSAMALDNVLKNLGVSDKGINSIESAIEQLEKLSSFDDSEIRSALSNTVVQLGDVDMSLKVVNVAMEVARAKNISLADATQKLSLGLLGNTRGLKDLGINVKDFGEAASLTATDKLEILNTVMGKVGGSMTDFGETVKGVQAASITAFGNLKEEIGEDLSGIVKYLTSFTTGFVESITIPLALTDEFATSLDDAQSAGRTLAKVGLQIGQGFSLAGNFIATTAFAIRHFGDVIKGNTDIGDIITEQWNDWKTHWDKVWEEYNKAPEENAKNTSKTVQDLIANLEGLLKNFGGTLTDFSNTATDAFEPLWKPITLQGGNLPELARFVGNLRYAPVVKKKMEVEININVNDKTGTKTGTTGTKTGTKTGTNTGAFYAHQMAMQLKKEIAYESHGTGGG